MDVAGKLVRAGAAVALASALGISLLRTSSPVDSAVMIQPAPPPPPSTVAHKGPYACVIVVDAARFDEFNLSKMPNLAALAARGTQFSQASVGQLPSITETSHATIGTGVLPSRHQILGDTWRVPGTNTMSPNLLNSALTRTGYIGKFIRQTRSPTLAALVHRAYPGSIVATLSGHKVYAADALGAGAADYVGFGGKNGKGQYVPGGIPGHLPAPKILKSPQLILPTYPRVPGVEDGWTTTFAEKFLFKYHPRVVMMNLPEVDVTGHVVGTDAAVMTPLLGDVDKQIGRIVAAYGRAKMLADTTFIVTSDHGMVPALRTVSSDQIERIIAAAGGQPLYVGHGDYSPIWLKNPATISKVAQALADAAIPHVAAVFAKTPTGIFGLVSPVSRLADPDVRRADQDLLGTMNAAESADIVLLYDENTMTLTPSYIKINRKGDHGGATWGAQHIPMVIAGPGTKQGYISPYPARLIDVAPTVEMALDIRPQKQDGVPLAEAFIAPPVWATPLQNAVQASRLTDVQALEKEAVLRP